MPSEIMNGNENEMKMPDLSKASSKEAALNMVKILNSKKARDLKLLYVEEQTIIADYFVICSGTSNTHIKSLAGELEYKMTLAGRAPIRMDGYSEGTWVVMDFGDVMVHIFGRDTRDFYKLEKFWADAEEINIDALTEE